MSNSRAPQQELSVIRRAIAGSRSAFEMLYRWYADRVRYAVARAALQRGYRQDIDELDQEVWCRLLADGRRLLGRYDPARGSFENFIGMIAFQQALVLAKRARHRVSRAEVELESERLVDDQSLRFAELLAQRELLQKLLARADAELEPGELALLQALYIDQRTSRSVASQLGITENAVCLRSRRLRKKLARMVEVLSREASPASDDEGGVGEPPVMMGMAMASPPSGERGPRARPGGRSTRSASEDRAVNERYPESMR